MKSRNQHPQTRSCPPADLHPTSEFNLRRVVRIVTQFFDGEMRRHGFRSTQWSVLSMLSAISPSNMAVLSEMLGMERTTLLRNLRPLQREGLVAVEGGGRGGRVRLLITAKGQKQIETLAPTWEAAQRTAVEVLGKKRWSDVLAELDVVAAALKTNKRTIHSNAEVVHIHKSTPRSLI